MIKFKSQISSKFYFLFIFILAISVWFRFVNFSEKVYWKDEVYTSLMLSGYAPTEVRREITGKLVTVEDLQRYQHLNPDKNVVDTVKLLAREDPQHTPLWYVLTRLWIEKVGDSIANIRAISVFISLLALPLTYWLCLELFNSVQAGLIGTLIVAISPFHILYAQEAREYSLWTVTILLLSKVMLRAMRRKTIQSWLLYTLIVSLGLYSYFLNLLVVFAHGVYVFTVENFKFRKKTTISFLIASSIGLLTFVPWLVNVDKIDALGWAANKISFIFLVQLWILNLGRVFMDINFDFGNPLTYLLLPLILLVAYSTYFLYTKAPRNSWIFVLILIGMTTLPFIVQDLLIGGRRSSAARFLTPLYLGIQINIAYLIACKTNLNYFDKKQINFWDIVLAIIITIGIFSGLRIAKTDSSWNKYGGEEFIQMAQIINSSSNPIVIDYSSYSSGVAEILTLSHLLKSNVRIHIDSKPNLLDFSDENSDLFLIDPPKNLKGKSRKTQIYNIESVYQGRYKRLWKIQR